jgi:anti-sigma B factor antagonist
MWKSTNFKVEREEGKAPGAVIFRLFGPFTVRDMFSSLTPLALREIFQTSRHHEWPAVYILDFTSVPYMDSTGLGVIARQYRKCNAEGIRFTVVGACARVLQRFKISKLDTLISMASTVEEAEIWPETRLACAF